MNQKVENKIGLLIFIYLFILKDKKLKPIIVPNKDLENIKLLLEK